MRRIIPCSLFIILFVIYGSIVGGITIPSDFPHGIYVTISKAASRVEGVAPLSVVFNAALTESNPTQSPLHNYEYSWDFDDSPSSVWGTSGKSKNSDKGAIASHLFETAGVYNVTLTVKNSSGAIVDTGAFEIVVTDQDTVFSGTNTTCISDSINGDFTGCPTGATQITTDDISNLTSYTGAGKRLLFHRGSEWDIVASPTFGGGSISVIGAYGSCSEPSNQGICNNAPVINMSGDIKFISLSYKHDWRIQDITFANLDKLAEVITGATDIKEFLALRLKITGFDIALNIATWRTAAGQFNEKNSLISCKITNVRTNGIFIGSERLVLMGNIIQHLDISHVVRIWQAYIGVIGHNIISGSSVTSGLGRHALKLHSLKEGLIGDYATTGGGGVEHRTKFTWVANNIFGGSGPWPVSIGPENNLLDERVSDVVFEKNRLIADYGTLSSTPVTVGLMFETRYLTARNNIINGSGSGKNYTAITVARRGIEPTPLGNRIYNNTIYNESSINGTVKGISVTSSASDTQIRNNLVSYPNVITKSLIVDASTIALESNNILTDNPEFVYSAVPPLFKDFHLTAESIDAINKGYQVPVIDDYTGTPRTGIIDIGAYSY